MEEIKPLPDWWRSWFGPAYLAIYDPVLVQRASSEVDQLEALLTLQPPADVLDLACGQGRHAIELARRGYRVTGVDLSAYLLQVATQRAEEANVPVRFIEGDIRKALGEGAFDVAINLFTSFGYFEDDADSLEVLRAGRTALRPHGRFVLEVVNGERLRRDLRPREWFTQGELTVIDEQTMDPERRRLIVRRTVIDDANEQVLHHSLRLYDAGQLRELFEQAGFTDITVFGGWQREPVTIDSVRLVAVALGGGRLKS